MCVSFSFYTDLMSFMIIKFIQLNPLKVKFCQKTYHANIAYLINIKKRALQKKKYITL